MYKRQPSLAKRCRTGWNRFSGLPLNISKWISSNPTQISMCFTKAEIREVMILGVAVEAATYFWHLIEHCKILFDPRWVFVIVWGIPSSPEIYGPGMGGWKEQMNFFCAGTLRGDCAEPTPRSKSLSDSWTVLFWHLVSKGVHLNHPWAPTGARESFPILWLHFPSFRRKGTSNFTVPSQTVTKLQQFEKSSR